MTTSRSPGRPRSAEVHAALLTATQELLIEVGFDRLTVDAVAARGGTSKNTIYRRWSNKTELVVAAVKQQYHVPEAPDLGSLREDLLACARAYTEGDDRTQQLLATLLTEMVRNRQLRTTARETLGAPYDALFTTVLARAVARGLIDPNTDTATIGTIFPAFAFHRVAVESKPVDEELVIRIVDGCLLPLLSAPQRPDSPRQQKAEPPAQQPVSELTMVAMGTPPSSSSP